MRATIAIFVFVLGTLAAAATLANGPDSANGLISVYADLYQGRATASGMPYDRAALTAAHATLPFGTVVRVANFESGRMVDLRVNDRKREDGRLITISRAAADVIGLDPNRTAPGSLLVIQTPSPAGSPAVTQAPMAPAAPSLPSAQGAEPRKFRPLAGLFGKEAAPVTNSPVPSGQPLQGGNPGERLAPPVAPKSGGLFAQKSAVPAAAYPDPIPMPHGVAPAPTGGELMAMNASSSAPRTMAPQPVPATPAPAPVVNLPPASPSAPYRAQFGAFRRVASAEELAAILDSAGIPSSVFAAPGSGLNVVVTDGGFRTAEEAQRWIDFEGARRRWTERPVVIR